MALQDSYTVTSGTGENSPYEGYPIAQAFTASSDYNISSVQLYLYRSGTLTSATVEIQETTGGLPNGSTIVSKTIVGSVIPTSLGWVEFAFATTPSLTNGVTYAIVLSIIGSSDFVVWNYNYVGGGDLGNSYSDELGWYVFPDIISPYQVYGDTASVYIDLAGTIAGVGAVTGILTKKFTNSNVATNSRLVAAGSNQVWIEDI
jgi:hypothetical protein